MDKAGKYEITILNCRDFLRLRNVRQEGAKNICDAGTMSPIFNKAFICM